MSCTDSRIVSAGQKFQPISRLPRGKGLTKDEPTLSFLKFTPANLATA